MLYPIGIYLFPGIFRIMALKGKDREFMFNFSKFLQMIWGIIANKNLEIINKIVKNVLLSAEIERKIAFSAGYIWIFTIFAADFDYNVIFIIGREKEQRERQRLTK